jgi:hypothetical protein
METIINILPNTLTEKNRTWTNLLAIADHQSEHKTLWFLFSLIFQGVCFLPIPAVLIYYYHAPIIVLPITFGLYLSNIIVGMGGSGIRVVIGLFLLSVFINLAMLTVYVF